MMRIGIPREMIQIPKDLVKHLRDLGMIPSGKELVVWFVTLCREQGWSQTCAGNLLGVNQTTIGEWISRVDRDDAPDLKGKSREKLADFYLRTQEKPFRRFSSHLISDAVCRAERPEAFRGFRGQPSTRDKLAFIYSYVLRHGASADALRELHDYSDEILRADDGDDASKDIGEAVEDPAEPHSR